MVIETPVGHPLVVCNIGRGRVVAPIVRRTIHRARNFTSVPTQKDMNRISSYLLLGFRRVDQGIRQAVLNGRESDSVWVPYPLGLNRGWLHRHNVQSIAFATNPHIHPFNK